MQEKKSKIVSLVSVNNKQCGQSWAIGSSKTVVGDHLKSKHALITPIKETHLNNNFFKKIESFFFSTWKSQKSRLSTLEIGRKLLIKKYKS